MSSIGPTQELSLRVSIAALVRVLFEHPSTGEWMLALEHKATVYPSETGLVAEVKAQPFGGALCIHKLSFLHNRIGDFHFDSEESYQEQDFRIFIRPADWEAVREFCLEHLNQPNDGILESDPSRELTEEFFETLGIRLQPHQYTYQATGIIIEHHPSPTENIHARGYPTARIYRIFEARILDSDVATAMIENSLNRSNSNLRELALQDFRKGGPGRANAVLTLPFRDVNDCYLSVPLKARDQPIMFQNHLLDETVAAILGDLTVPKYQRL